MATTILHIPQLGKDKIFEIKATFFFTLLINTCIIFPYTLTHNTIGNRVFYKTLYATESFAHIPYIVYVGIGESF